MGRGLQAGTVFNPLPKIEMGHTLPSPPPKLKYVGTPLIPNSNTTSLFPNWILPSSHQIKIHQATQIKCVHPSPKFKNASGLWSLPLIFCPCRDPHTLTCLWALMEQFGVLLQTNPSVDFYWINNLRENLSFRNILLLVFKSKMVSGWVIGFEVYKDFAWFIRSKTYMHKELLIIASYFKVCIEIFKGLCWEKLEFIAKMGLFFLKPS